MTKLMSCPEREGGRIGVQVVQSPEGRTPGGQAEADPWGQMQSPGGKGVGAGTKAGRSDVGSN